jgi:hypothetical protein
MVNRVGAANLLKTLESRKKHAPAGAAFLQQSPLKRLAGPAR